MCGIFGYIGNKNASEIVMTGLKRLEYRGYDSWGIAVIDTDIEEHHPDRIKVTKKVGSIGDYSDNLNLPFSFFGIGHTRWATHGSVNEVNAHPHYSTDRSFVLAQNGILENFEILKKKLIEKGYQFKSQTDTEVIVRLIEDKLKTIPDLKTALQSAFLKMEGRNTIILITNKGQIIAARNGSPLVIGKNDDTGELFLSSDTLSFAPFASKVIVIDNGELVEVSDNHVRISDIKTGEEIQKTFEQIDFETQIIDKEGFEHFMLKEIFDSPYVIRTLANQPKQDYIKLAEAIKSADKVYTIGSGTAGVAASQIAYFLRYFGHVDATGLVGADATEYLPLITLRDLIIAPSQSGETADVLEVLEQLKDKGVKIATFVNMPGSTMSRISDYKFLSQAGPEICVMSTKVFVSQIAWGYLLSKTVEGSWENGAENLKDLAVKLEEYLKTEDNLTNIKSLADYLKDKKDIFLLAKGQNYQIIREGMIKLIEGSYKHAHAIPSGDLKHYAITLMEDGVPVLAVTSNDSVQSDVRNAINEVKARGAQVIGISPKQLPNLDFYLPVPDTGETSSILNVIPLQLLAYFIAVKLKNNVDKPRNIAKSVTVK